MKKVLFVLGEYIQRTAQNGLCIDDIKRIMESDDLNVDVVCVENNIMDVNNKEHNVYSIVSRGHDGVLFKKMRKFIKLLHIPVGSNSLTNKIIKEITRLDNINCYDAIIAVVNPVESAEAVYKYKKSNRNIKFVLYEIDPTSNRYKKPKGLLQVFWKYRSTIWEMKIYTLADKIIHMKTHALHFSQDIYKVFHDKVSYLDIPTFKNNNSKLEIKYNKPIQSFIYAGAFYPGLREPNYLFNSLSVISKKKKIKVDIYTGKNMLKEIKKLVLARENIFSLHNLVSQSELEKKIIKADVLLSVGNHDSDFLPSKTLYYISSGKPVIHFYSDDNDVSNEYFKKYP